MVTIRALGNTYPIKEELKKIGFRWHPLPKLWINSDANPNTLRAIKEFESNQVRFLVEGELQEFQYTGAPEGMVPFPYQIEGAKFALSQRSVLIADEMGLGKTIQALLAARSARQKTLVVCPASLLINWRREADKWAPEVDFTIISWTKLKNLEEKYPFIIADEAHYAKNYKSQRCKALKEACKNCSKIIFLTGTPILNRPIEIFPLLAISGHPLASNYISFVEKYCDAEKTEHGWCVKGASNLDELKCRLSDWMIRRTKKQVLAELPSKTRLLSTIEMGKSKRLDALVLQEKILCKEARRTKKRLCEIASQTAEFDRIAKVRAEIALEKLPYALEEIESMLEECEKIVVFWHHKPPLYGMKNSLSEKGIKCVEITGDMKPVERTASIDNFQKSDSRVILLTFGAGSEGITLTASSNILMCECEWTPAKLLQAEDRCHRIGQKNAVTIRYLVVENSLDARIAKVAQEKSEIIEQILDGEGFVDI